MKKVLKILLNVLAVSVIALALVLLAYQTDSDFSQWDINITEILAEATQNKETLSDNEDATTSDALSTPDGIAGPTEETTASEETRNEPENAADESIESAEDDQPGYIELYGLEHVDKPVKRTDDEVLQRLEELSEEYDLVKEVYENRELYSMELLANLADNPEMAAYVLGFIGSMEADGEAEAKFSQQELEAEYPLLLQFDPRWGYFEYGGKPLGITGCGPTCLAMTILYLTDETNVTPDKIAEYSLKKDYYIEDVGTAWKMMEEFPKLYGLTVVNPSIKEESMKAELDKGNILICSMKSGEFTSGGHFIVVYGYDENGFKVNDPKCVARSRKTWNYSEFGNEIKGIWSIGQENGE